MKTKLIKRTPTKEGLLIKKVRMDNGLTQREFADVIGATQATVSNWETFRIRNISPCFFEPLKEFFGVDMEQVICNG